MITIIILVIYVLSPITIFSQYFSAHIAPPHFPSLDFSEGLSRIRYLPTSKGTSHSQAQPVSECQPSHGVSAQSLGSVPSH